MFYFTDEEMEVHGKRGTQERLPSELLRVQKLFLLTQVQLIFFKLHNQIKNCQIDQIKQKSKQKEILKNRII